MKISLYFLGLKTLLLFSVIFLSGLNISAQTNIASAKGIASAKDDSSPRHVNLSKSGNALTIFDLEKTAFAQINEKRAENCLPLLEWSEEVARIARLHSENMAKHKFFSHRGLDGLMVDDRADALGISQWRAIGENIAFNRGYENPAESAVMRWLLSPAHRENILNSRWKESAVGAAVADDGSYYFTQVFLLRK